MGVFLFLAKTRFTHPALVMTVVVPPCNPSYSKSYEPKCLICCPARTKRVWVLTVLCLECCDMVRFIVSCTFFLPVYCPCTRALSSCCAVARAQRLGQHDRFSRISRREAGRAQRNTRSRAHSILVVFFLRQAFLFGKGGFFSFL